MAGDASVGGHRRVIRCGATREYIKDPWSPPSIGLEEDKIEEEDLTSQEKLDTLRRKAENMYEALKSHPSSPLAVTVGTRVATKRRYVCWDEIG